MRARSHSAFTLIELMITVAILSIVLLGAMMVLLTSVRASESLLVSANTDTQARRAFDAIAGDLQNSSFDDPTHGIDALMTWSGDTANQLVFKTAEVNDQTGDLDWSAETYTIHLVYADDEANDNADNDNDGLIDEMDLWLSDSSGLLLPLANNVRKGGLEFRRLGNELAIRVEFQQVDTTGSVASSFMETNIRLRN